MPLEISTAGLPIKSEGVGKMLLYTPDGKPFPGFDNVIIAKAASEKLASVGEVCKHGLVCVFDEKGLTTYKKDDFSVKGEVFTYDVRDPVTRLYLEKSKREKYV
jgi:hypothetical protein